MNEEQELPQGWVWTTVDQLGKSVTGNTPSTSNPEFYGGDIPFFKPGDLGSGYSISEAETYITEAGAQSVRILPPYSTLVTCIGATIGKTGFSTVAGATNQQINALIPETAVVVPQFAYFGFISPILFRQILDNASSTTLPILNKSKFEALKFPLPPLPEQRRIVAKLEELFSKLDAGVAAVRRTQALLKRYRQSVLHAAVTGELTRAWRETHPTAPAEAGAALLQRIRAERRAQWEAAQVAKRGGRFPLGEDWKAKYVESEAVDTAGLPELPEGWAWEKLELLTTLITKGASPTWQGFNYVIDEQVLFVTSENVRSGFLDISRPKYLEWAFNDKQKASILQEGDLLLNIVGASIGRAAMYNLSQPANINQAVSLIRLTLADLREYVMLFLNSNQAIQFYNAEKVDVARANLSLKDVANIPIALPQSLDELKMVLQEMQCRLSVIDGLEINLANELKRAERLRQSILHQAFTGQLVPQDATDEPAALLLSRIITLRSLEPKIKKTRNDKIMKPSDERTTQSKNITDILQKNGSLNASEVWKESGMSIEDFYAQLKEELDGHRIVVKSEEYFDQIISVNS
jgi:type I restriction enzyme S subunit